MKKRSKNSKDIKRRKSKAERFSISDVLKVAFEQLC
jgi:hypothetical protein